MIGNIFDIFSRREKDVEIDLKPLIPEFKNRFLMLIRDSVYGSFFELLGHLRAKLAYLHGQPVLRDPKFNPADDALAFLSDCEDDHFLDAIEYIFQLEHGRFFSMNESKVIDQVNQFFVIDKLPYFLTKTVREEFESSFHGNPTTGIRVVENPRVIRKDSEVLHNTAIEPVLTLLQKPDLLNANEEFMLGLEDYRKGQYKDCVTKCCSSLESVMKVICKRRGFPYTEKDTASPLLKTILSNTNLDNFWEQPIMLIATIRNRLSFAHGSGSKEKQVSEHIAKYSINATASAILLLHDEAYN